MTRISLDILSTSSNSFSYILTSRDSLASSVCDTQLNTRNLGAYIVCNLFFPVLPFRLNFFQSRTRPQTFRQIPKETNKQHGRKNVLLEYIAIFLCIDNLREILC